MTDQYPLYPIDDYCDFPHFIDGIAGKHADKPALTTYTEQGEAVTHTFAQLAAQARALAVSLCDMGLAGKNIAIAAENSDRWIVAALAITLAGATAVTVDVEQPDEWITGMARRADAAAVFCSDTFLPLFQDEPQMRAICLEGTDEDGESYDALLARGARRLAAGEAALPAVNPGDPALIVFTSGTTCVSKPVVLTHRNVMHNMAMSHAMLDLGARMYTSLPLYHTYGLNMGVLSNLMQGQHVCLNGNLKTMMRDLRLFEPDNMMAVPLILEALYAALQGAIRRQGIEKEARRELARFRRPRPFCASTPSPLLRGVAESLFGARLRIIVCGGAHLSESIARDLRAFGLLVLQGYGITECSPLVSVNRNQSVREDSVGQVIPGMEVKIVDGEICVKGDSVFAGYYKDPALTAQTLVDGWFKTGDIGSVDGRGFLRLEGRTKNLIVFKNGKKVAPEEIERYVAGIPLIQEAVAYGAAAGATADDVKLALMVYPNPALTEGMENYAILEKLQEEIAAINRRLPLYKQIRIIKLKDSPFEKTSLRKIKRFSIPN